MTLPADADGRGSRALPAQTLATIQAALLVFALRFAFDAALVVNAIRRSLRALPTAPPATIVAAFLAGAVRFAFDLAFPVHAERSGLRTVTAHSPAAVVAAFVVLAGGEAACLRGDYVSRWQRTGGVVATVHHDGQGKQDESAVDDRLGTQ